MSLRVQFSRRADGDLTRIWRYTSERWGRPQADRYIGQIRDAVTTLMANPLAGDRSEVLGDGYRRYRVGSHVVFYRLAPDTIRVVRVLHIRMDFGQHL